MCRFAGSSHSSYASYGGVHRRVLLLRVSCRNCRNCRNFNRWFRVCGFVLTIGWRAKSARIEHLLHERGSRLVVFAQGCGYLLWPNGSADFAHVVENLLAFLRGPVLFGVPDERPRAYVRRPSKRQILLLLDVASRYEQAGVSAGAVTFEDQGAIHAAGKAYRAVDFVQRVRGALLPQVVHDHDRRVVFRCEREESLQCLVILLVDVLAGCPRADLR